MPSLLPQQILPPSAAWGRVLDADGNEMGTVTIDKNWWLFLLNVSQQVLTTGPASGGGAVPATAYLALESVDFDVASVDAIAARQLALQANVLAWLSA